MTEWQEFTTEDYIKKLIKENEELKKKVFLYETLLGWIRRLSKCQVPFDLIETLKERKEDFRTAL